MSRFVLALKSFWKTLADASFAERVEPLFQPTVEGADLRIIALLQRDGRLVDFLLEDVSAYDDAQIGAAVRSIHRDCRKVLMEYLTIEPVRSEPEDSSVSVPADFDAVAVRLSGNITGSPPFRGVLRHRGWRVAAHRLPALPASRDGTAILAPAEVDVP